MRLLLLFLITLCVTVSFYYWSYGDLRIWAWNSSEDSTSVPNVAGTGTMIDRARAAVPWPGKETAEALNLERIQPADLDKDVKLLRDKLAQAAVDMASRDVTLQSLQATSQSSAEEIRREHRRADALAVRLAALQQDAASQIGALQKQLDDERARSLTHERDQAAARDQLARAVRDDTSVNEARISDKLAHAAVDMLSPDVTLQSSQ